MKITSILVLTNLGSVDTVYLVTDVVSPFFPVHSEQTAVVKMEAPHGRGAQWCANYFKDVRITVRDCKNGGTDTIIQEGKTNV